MRNRGRWVLVIGMLTIALLVAGTAVTVAEGRYGPNFETFPLTCNGTVYLNTASPGLWSGGHIVGTNGDHLVPYDYSISVSQGHDARRTRPPST